MANVTEEWLKKAISDGYIKYIEYNKFTNPIVIGNGGFGTVHKYEWRDSELTVALKCLKVDTSMDEKTIKDFIKELKLLRSVSCHSNVITFYGITKDNNGYYNMILQYADDGTLREYLMKNLTKLQWTDKLYIAKEIALGLLFLHDNNIIHRDLHSKNILIHQKQPMITDFGLSKQMNEMSMTSNSIVHGIPAYIEPKCFIDPKYKRDKRSDVYSFGQILWEISSGRPPFQSFESSGYSLAIHIYQGKRENPIEGTPSKYIELYKKCWDNDPDNRPETKSVLNTLKLISNVFSERRTSTLTSTTNTCSTIIPSAGLNSINNTNSLSIHTSSLNRDSNESKVVINIYHYIYNIIPNSDLITEEHAAKISSWIDHAEIPYSEINNPYKYILIFKATKNGFNVKDFYKKCNKKSRTVVVLRVNQTNEILGGYNPLEWKKTNSRKYAVTNDSFIFKFSDTESIISKVENVNKAIYYDDCSGPSFGKRDLSLQSNMIVNNQWYCEKKSYDKQIRSVSGFFSASDYEVYKIVNLSFI